MSTMTATTQQLADKISKHVGCRVSDVIPVLDLRGNWVLFEAGYTYALTDGERCQTIDEHLDGPGRQHLCRWNDLMQEFERI